MGLFCSDVVIKVVFEKGGRLVVFTIVLLGSILVVFLGWDVFRELLLEKDSILINMRMGFVNI